MNREEVVSWALAYIEAPPDITSRHPCWWAVDKFFMPLDSKTSVRDCWETILEIIAREPPGRVLSVLGAGPVEDLIGAHGPEIIEQIELESSGNPLLRAVLRIVRRTSTDEVWRRVLAAREKE